MPQREKTAAQAHQDEGEDDEEVQSRRTSTPAMLARRRPLGGSCLARLATGTPAVPALISASRERRRF